MMRRRWWPWWCRWRSSHNLDAFTVLLGRRQRHGYYFMCSLWRFTFVTSQQNITQCSSARRRSVPRLIRSNGNDIDPIKMPVTCVWFILSMRCRRNAIQTHSNSRSEKHTQVDTSTSAGAPPPQSTQISGCTVHLG